MPNILRFSSVTDLTNNSYILLQTSDLEYFQFNIHLVLQDHLDVKQTDLSDHHRPVQNDEILVDLTVDEKLKQQVMSVCRNDQDLYNRSVLNFIQLIMNLDPYTLCKYICIF